MRIERIESVSTSASGGVSGCCRAVKQMPPREKGGLTLSIWPRSFGVSFAQADAATFPSGGSSAVIVLRACGEHHIPFE